LNGVGVGMELEIKKISGGEVGVEVEWSWNGVGVRNFELLRDYSESLLNSI